MAGDGWILKFGVGGGCVDSSGASAWTRRNPDSRRSDPVSGGYYWLDHHLVLFAWCACAVLVGTLI